MNQLIVKTDMSMTSREIAELTGKNHGDVMRDTRNMLDELKIDQSSFADIFFDSYNREQPCFKLPKDLTLTLVSGYNVKMRKRIIDRWLELEAAPAQDPMQVLNDPAAMRGLLLTYTEKVIVLEETVKVLEPKAEALDRIATVTEGSFCLRDAAKTLQAKEKTFIQLLVEKEWIYRRPMGSGWLAYSDKLKSGLMEHKITTGEKSDGSEWANTQARITARGIAKLSQLLGLSSRSLAH